MEIRALELENVKSYERERVPFAHGTNAICGPNGAGKSTILEAIGYALFDVAPCRPIGNLVREGEKTATITVTVLAGDEREYQVVRRCGARNQYYVYDPEIRQRLAEGPADVVAWLREQFGVEEVVDLAALFRDAVGVPQGLLTAAFLQSPRERKAVFDPLLRVEEYGEAFTRLLEARRALEERIHAGEKQIAAYQAEVKELPRLEGEAAALDAEIGAAESRLAQLAPRLAALAEEVQTLEAARDRLRDLTAEAGRLDERRHALQDRAAQAVDALARAQAAAQTVAESEDGHRAYLAAQERRQALEAEEQARSQALQSAAELRTRQEVAADRIARLERELQAALAAAREAEGLQAAAEAQERLERELAQAQARAQQWQKAVARLKQERCRLQQLEARLGEIAAGLAERQALEAERQERQHSLGDLNEALRSTARDEAHEKALLGQMLAQAEALSEIEGAQCPVCEGELSAARRSELLARDQEQAARQEMLLAGLRARTAKLSQKAETAGRELKAVEERLSRLPRPAERETGQADCERQRAVVQEAEQEAGRLAEAHARAQALAAELAQAGDPRAAYQRALAVAEQRTALESDLSRERANAASLAARLGELEGRLAGFAGLDGELDTVRAELEATEPAHLRYLQHEREAADVAARQAQLAEAQAGLEEAEAARRSLEETLEAARAAYRREEHERASAAHLAAAEERSRLEAQAELQRDRLEAAQARLGELQGIAGRLQEAEQELVAWRELGQALEHFRKVLKEAGPQVTRALVEVISYQAARLYADIISDPHSRLRWGEDYEVLVRHGAYERSYQQLSGGEQMAAALAIRLALLREVSGIDVVFFDEPTSNLDDTRRDNLAEQILGIRYFTQLFVVSHDDTFERATDHTVRVAKVDGASRVVA